jgi:choline dehydrogenase-like flavoprotein
VTPHATEILVIGSGAGGAITAARLAEAGRDVTLIEEGPWLDADCCEPFSREEMTLKYRQRGVSATLGRPPIAFVEGRCIGGGTEINSGLYHRPPPDVLDAWRDEYDIVSCDADVIGPYADAIEKDLSVSLLPEPPPRASALLDYGAAALGWKALEVPRVYRYDAHDGDGGRKQTMSRTYIPRAVAAGARVIPDCRVVRLVRRGRRVRGAVCASTRGGRADRVTIEAEEVFVCAGAVGTPALLQRSGIFHNIGRGLKLHPTIKLAARFPDPIDGRSVVPMHQVKEFAPDVTLGGSASRRGYVALALADVWDEGGKARMSAWEDIAVYYASIRSEGAGRVLAVPGLGAPIVTYRLTEADLSRLARGAVHLGELLFAAGAREIYPSIARSGPIGSPAELARLWDEVARSDVGLMTIHLFSSVRMGEDRRKTGADSYGRVWGVENLRVNDASLLPDAPGVNPQGSIMAFAARNCDHFLSSS